VGEYSATQQGDQPGAWQSVTHSPQRRPSAQQLDMYCTPPNTSALMPPTPSPPYNSSPTVHAVHVHGQQPAHARHLVLAQLALKDGDERLVGGWVGGCGVVGGGGGASHT
jgi:hypothetical protein